MEFTIRKGISSDMPAVLELIKELAHFEEEADAVEISSAELVQHGFGDQPLFNTYVAEINKSIVGMALFYPRYSTWKGPTIHLEDLIVTASSRGLGIGKALYKKVLEYSYAKGVKRVEWAVLDWNTPAIEFYEHSGAKVLSDWDTAQITREAVQKYLQRP
jgi:GNAT superfamily N-acetyltransferase